MQRKDILPCSLKPTLNQNAEQRSRNENLEGCQSVVKFISRWNEESSRRCVSPCCRKQKELSKGKLHFLKGQVSDLHFRQQGLSGFVWYWAITNSVGQNRMTEKVKLSTVPAYHLFRGKKRQPAWVDGSGNMGGIKVAGNLLVDYLVHKNNINSKSLLKSWSCTFLWDRESTCLLKNN